MENLTDHLPWNQGLFNRIDWEDKTGKIVWSLIILLLVIFPIRGTSVDPTQQLEKIRAFSRICEFDYATWTVSALSRKLIQSSLGVNRYVSQGDGIQIIEDYLELKDQAAQLETELTNTLSNPELDNHEQLAVEIRDKLTQIKTHREQLAPFVEQILQDQLNTALADLDISLGGQLIPPVLFRSEPNSFALIVSPRDEIRQEANLMLIRGLSIDEIIQLENDIETNLDLSALVVGIGGVGLYPSMIIESGNLDWLIRVIGHEWTHNYLTLRPLGAHYNASPELKTINETIADLSADEIQSRTFELFYPEMLTQAPIEEEPISSEDTTESKEITAEESKIESEPLPFDFRAEMHTTRLEVDRLLDSEEIDAAEIYMESRRVFFWENGYQIRKLNQAYFAFHGSYAAEPGGASDQEGADLGTQLRELKDQAPSYKSFMRQVAWRWKLEQFQSLFDKKP